MEQQLTVKEQVVREVEKSYRIRAANDWGKDEPYETDAEETKLKQRKDKIRMYNEIVNDFDEFLKRLAIFIPPLGGQDLLWIHFYVKFFFKLVHPFFYFQII